MGPSVRMCVVYGLGWVLVFRAPTYENECITYHPTHHCVAFILIPLIRPPPPRFISLSVRSCGERGGDIASQDGGPVFALAQIALSHRQMLNGLNLPTAPPRLSAPNRIPVLQNTARSLHSHRLAHAPEDRWPAGCGGPAALLPQIWRDALSQNRPRHETQARQRPPPDDRECKHNFFQRRTYHGLGGLLRQARRHLEPHRRVRTQRVPGAGMHAGHTGSHAALVRGLCTDQRLQFREQLNGDGEGAPSVQVAHECGHEGGVALGSEIQQALDVVRDLQIDTIP